MNRSDLAGRQLANNVDAQTLDAMFARLRDLLPQSLATEIGTHLNASLLESEQAITEVGLSIDKLRTIEDWEHLADKLGVSISEQSMLTLDRLIRLALSRAEGVRDLARIDERAREDERRRIKAEDPPDTRVVLGKDHYEQPIVDGKRVRKLTKAEYDVVKALIDAEGPLGKDQLSYASGVSDPARTLRALRKKPRWGNVIRMAGTKGKGYEILTQPIG